MARGDTMSLCDHWIVKAAIAHNTAVRAAKNLDPKKIASGIGRTPEEKEVSRLSCLFYDMLHQIEPLVRHHGIEDFFGPAAEPPTLG